MVKMIRIIFAGANAIDIEDDKEILWKLISNKDYDWTIPLLMKDSTNSMNDRIINMDKFLEIKRYNKFP